MISFLTPLNPPLPLHLYKPLGFAPLPFSKATFSLSFPKSRTCFSLSSSNPSNSNRDEFLWLREEQRWLREEQRWLREEQRWLRDRESLLREIQSLKLQIQALEKRMSLQEGVPVPETMVNVGALLQVLKEKSLIAESSSSASPNVLEKEVEEDKEVIGVLGVEEKTKSVKSRTLKKGSEGEEVREMQEALQKLGFYSGEEDMEYSSFSTGTERAVKTWQATLGSPEDGIMTAELLDRLYLVQQTDGAGSNISAHQKESSLTLLQKEGSNGAADASITGISETQQKVVKEGVGEIEVSQHRVFLLGENRWEEPSRLAGKDKQVVGSQTKDDAKRCLTCRGEGRLLCTECDGTGEPNIEPQFLEWVDEGAKCPYCEGLGYIICDVCEGKKVI